MLPRRFLNGVVWLAALLAGVGVQTLVQWTVGERSISDTPTADVRARTPGVRRRVAGAAVLAAVAVIVAVDYAPYQRLVTTSSYPRTTHLVKAAAPFRDAGRLAFFTYGKSEQSLLPLLAGFDLADGYSMETTPHLDTIIMSRLADRSGFPGFIVRTLLDWNVGVALVEQRNTALAAALETAGFVRTPAGEPDTVMLVGSGSRPIQTLTRNAIVIGRGAQTTAMAYPWMSYGTSWNIDDYDDAYIDHFDLIYLYDFRYRDAEQLTQRIRAWVAAGKTVVLDCTAMPDPTLLGVSAFTIEVPAQPVFRAGAATDIAFERAAEQPFGDDAAPWRGVTYTGLDGSLLDVADATGVLRPVLGYRTVDDGRVYFAGINWVAHAVSTRDQAAVALLDRFFSRAAPQRALVQPGLAVTAQTEIADQWGFSYDVAAETLVQVAETWSPH